jgi:hypothetical protein
VGKHVKMEAKAKIIIFFVVKDHLTPHIAKKTIVKEMYEALVCLYHSSCVYLARVIKFKDQLVAIGTKVEDKELVFVTPSHLGVTRGDHFL